MLFLVPLFTLTTASAQQLKVTLDPARTTIDWTLKASLHTVHGTFKLKSGELSFNRTSGNATGELVVDATSGQSGNSSRDSKMHKDVLESKRYPEITFIPKKVVGEVADHGASTIQVQGRFHIHGTDHDVTLLMPVQVEGNWVKTTSDFTVPYQAWGMKNPGNVFLHVDDKVQISISAEGTMTRGAAAAAN